MVAVEARNTAWVAKEMPTLDANGARIAYAETGRGETVVLLHGSVSSSAQWRSLTEVLQGRWHVLAPDFHGYGQTDPRAEPALPGLGDAAALVDAILGRSAGRIHLVGHSYGGAVALRMASDRPGRLLSLTLIEPVAFHLLGRAPDGTREHDLLREVAAIAAAVTDAAATGDDDRGMARFIDYWSGAGTWLRLRPEARRALASQTAQVARDFRAVTNEPARFGALRRIAVPTLVLGGTTSPAPTLRIAELVAQLLPMARLQTVGGAGHMLPLTHGEAVNAAVADHLWRNRLTQPVAA
jgi:pimeloyl-ACP methyl ester carboxylesterase